jgi:CRISPR-associated protein Cas6/Cse3/CasE subtype I-E
MHQNNSLSEIRFLAPSVRNAYAAHKAAWQVMGQSPDKTRHFHHECNFLPSKDGALITIRARPEYLPPESTPVRTSYDAGLQLNFVLTACASTRQAGANREVPCLSRDQLVDWIDRHSLKKGFKVDHPLLVVDTQALPVIKPGNSVFFLNKAFYSGNLTVVDSELFSKTLAEGIGRHKGLGFGMLKIINTNN